jgi:hypothetical protein
VGLGTLGVGGEGVEGEALGDEPNMKAVPPGRLDFGEMAEEFGWERLWSGRSNREIWETFGINLSVGLLPTLFDVGMDSLAVRDYMAGTYYYKQTSDDLPANCRLTPENCTVCDTECFEKDPIFGYVTLACFFLPGLGFSFWTFLSLSNYLRGTDFRQADFRKNACFFLFFTPLALLSAATFPIQLFLVSLVALLNGGPQWTTLTAKYSIAEGLYDASIQFCVQLFIIFTMGDRLPSTIQYLSLSGSILMLAVPRIEAFLLDRGGATMPVKQKLLKTLYLFPLFFFNSIFKLGSIGLICAILRYNAITFYGILALVWIIAYFVFNEGCKTDNTDKYYHLILGVVVHVVSIGKIPRRTRIIDTKIRLKEHHQVKVRTLSSSQQMQNIIFQNVLWLVINSVMLIMLTILTHVRSELWTLWPVVDHRYSLASMPITRHIHIIVPVILSSGLLSLGLILLQLGFGVEQEEPEAIGLEPQCSHEGLEDRCAADVSVQGKVAKKLEPVLNIVASATDVEL